MKVTLGHSLSYIAIVLQLSTCVRSHLSVDQAQQINPSPAKKYAKKLRKEEGAIRLVGGSNDYEGE